MKNVKLNNCYQAAHNEWMKNGGVLVHGCLKGSGFTWGHAWVERSGKVFDASRAMKRTHYGIDLEDYMIEMKPIKTVRIKSANELNEHDLIGRFQISKKLRSMIDK